MKTKFITILFILFFTAQINAQNYKIDSGHSSVQIQVERFGVVDVIGRFKAVDGTIHYNDKDFSKTQAEAVIQVASYDANNTGGEEAVKSKAFLNEKEYPGIKFKSKKTITKSGVNYLIGDLTIHGVTKEIELPYAVKGPLLDLPTKKQSIAFKASITINRQDYGVSFNAKLPSGTSIVGDDIKITLTILGIAE